MHFRNASIGEAQNALESLLLTISDALKKGDSVTLTGFREFIVYKHKIQCYLDRSYSSEFR
jgi:nucleoid DNA-binding protein